jgi:hypothetical protein
MKKLFLASVSAIAPFARPAAGGVAVLALLAAFAAFEPARAGGYGTATCVGSPGSISCVGQWGFTGERWRPPDPQEEAESAERHRKWVTRCRPVVRQDHYGVSRYHYAKPGCEFGKFHD